MHEARVTNLITLFRMSLLVHSFINRWLVEKLAQVLSANHIAYTCKTKEAILKYEISFVERDKTSAPTGKSNLILACEKE